MKTILLPTDFSVESLNVLREYVESNNTQETLKVIIVHGVRLSNSISDLLMYNKGRHIAQLSNDAFNEAIEIIKNKYHDKIKFLYIDTLHGFVQSAFNDYLETNKVDLIVFPHESKWHFRDKKSFDLTPFIKKAPVEKWPATVVVNEDSFDRYSLSSIFSSLVPARRSA